MAKRKIRPKSKIKPKPKIQAKSSTSSNRGRVRQSDSSRTSSSTTSRRRVARRRPSSGKGTTNKSSQRKQDHKKRVFKGQKFRFQQRINKNSLRPGMIISFNYKGQYSTDPQPMVLVLNKRWLGKLHGININYCNYRQILQIAKIVNQRISPKAQKLGQKYRIVNPYGFYHVMLKSALRKFKKSIYRTYFVSKIKQPKLMDYRFKATGTDANTLTFYERDGKTEVRLTKVKPETIRKRAAGRSPKTQARKVDLNTKNPDRDNISKRDIKNFLNQKPGVGMIRPEQVDGVRTVRSVPNVKVVKKV